MPEWYVLDRTDYPGHSDFGDDSDRIAAIARVFPVFFLLVAALVCLTTMTRMVEEQRTQIGTLKHWDIVLAQLYRSFWFTRWWRL